MLTAETTSTLHETQLNPGSYTIETSPSIKQYAPHPALRHVWVVAGPAGCGKTTVASYMSCELDLPYLEGDEYHTQASVAKMAAGIALTDADRWDWLRFLRIAALEKIQQGAHGVVLTCSSLKRTYRDDLRSATENIQDVVMHFIYLSATEELLINRVAARKGHYMGANMVRSQLAELEPPAPDEADMVTVDVSGMAPEVQALVSKVVEDILNASAVGEMKRVQKENSSL
ncbi:carbohydrate kinase [Aulographum hederae CBS 113979]|uniref:Gluconokinase n=1 Tax=Aulographum hederae CBS 113979 TaxID=1176131 RepID=A0A6G1H7S2_9PEZI|nr:carbohydrate kinase [Aulographum hederae CBS 113979]